MKEEDALGSPVGTEGAPGVPRRRRVWQRVDDATLVRPADLLCSSSQAMLLTRVRAEIEAAQPTAAERHLLNWFTYLLMRGGRCGPHYLNALLLTGRSGTDYIGMVHRQALHGDVDQALEWLVDHGLLSGEGVDLVWSRRLLAGLTIQPTWDEVSTHAVQGT